MSCRQFGWNSGLVITRLLGVSAFLLSINTTTSYLDTTAFFVVLRVFATSTFVFNLLLSPVWFQSLFPEKLFWGWVTAYYVFSSSYQIKPPSCAWHCTLKTRYAHIKEFQTIIKFICKKPQSKNIKQRDSFPRRQNSGH